MARSFQNVSMVEAHSSTRPAPDRPSIRAGLPSSKRAATVAPGAGSTGRKRKKRAVVTSPLRGAPNTSNTGWP